MSQNHQHLLSSNPKTLRRHRRGKTGHILFPRRARVLLFDPFERFQSVQRGANATVKHPHAHDGSLLDRLEDAEEVLYRKLDPYLHHGEGDDALVLGSLRKPIDLPHFRGNELHNRDDNRRHRRMTRDSIRHEKIAFSRRERDAL